MHGPGERLVVVWRCTERCEAACPFCAFDVRLRRQRRDFPENEARRFGRLLAEWGRVNGREVLLSWLGGEPFLWPPLASLTRELRGARLRVALTTAGAALCERFWRDFCLEHLDELTVSLDGPPSVHDRLRGRPGLARTVSDALTDLRTRRGSAPSPRLRVNVVLLRDTVAQLGELLSTVGAAGADEVTFNALGGNDRPEFFPAHGLRPEDVRVLEQRLAAAVVGAASSPVVRGGPGYLARLRAAAEGRCTPVADCAPGRDFWFVEVDGRLAPCSFALDAGVSISGLRTPGDLDAIAARLAESRARARPAVCLDCPSTQVHEKFAEAAP